MSLKRREFISFLGGAAAAWPLAARAQQKMPRIGVLLVAGAEPMGPFREALSDLGYVDGKNIQIEVRSAEGKLDRLPTLAAELVRSKVDVIVASLTPAVTAAKNATRDIPIVMAPASNPVARGLIVPGGNVTGLSSDPVRVATVIVNLAQPIGGVTGPADTDPTSLASKYLQLIREVVPAVARIAVLDSADDPFTKPFLDQFSKGARTHRLAIHEVMLRGDGEDELEGAFAAIARELADAVMIRLPVHKSIVDLTLRYRLPSFSTEKFMTKAGGLASYSGSVVERARGVARYVDNILKGTNPAYLLVQEPTVFELTINLKTAKSLGLNLPWSLQESADEVIK